MFQAITFSAFLQPGSPMTELVLRFGLDLAAMTLLVFGMYYRRYRDKELVTAASLFNVFVFAVLAILSKVEFSLAAGFGLFAILALFTLRSEPISKTEMPYFFGSVAIAVICSIHGTTLEFAATMVVMVLIGAYVMDHPRILQSVDGVKITLDKIDSQSLSNPVLMRQQLTAKLGVDVMSYQILQLDFVNDLARINVFYRKDSLAARAETSATGQACPSGNATERCLPEGRCELNGPGS